MGAPYIYDISRLRIKDLHSATYIYVVRRLRVNLRDNCCFSIGSVSAPRMSVFGWVGFEEAVDRKCNKYLSDKLMAPYSSVLKQGLKYHENNSVLILTLIFPHIMKDGITRRWLVRFRCHGRGSLNYCIGCWVTSEPVWTTM